MQASSSLFYGILIKTTTLLTAAEAYNSIKGTVHAINLILLRRKSNLIVSNNSLLPNIPEELWEIVKNELILSRLKRERKKMKEQLLCENCRHVKSCYECRELKPLCTNVEWEISTCVNCQDSVNEFIMDAFNCEIRLKKIRRFLRPFGLKLHSTELLTSGVDPEPLYGDPESISPIAITLKRKKDVEAITEHPGDGGPVRLKIQNIPSSAFHISNSARKLLRKNVLSLCRNYSIQAVDPASNVSDETKEVKTKERKPRWIHYVSADC